MNDSIRHRGPDDDGVLVEGGVGIGMRRLSIVDLSARGHQPLFNEDELGRRGLQRRDLQPPRPPLAPGGERARLSRAPATPRCWSTATSSSAHASCCSASTGMFAFALSIGSAGGCSWRATDSGSSRSICGGRPRQLSFASEIRALALDGAGPLVGRSGLHAHLSAHRLRPVAGDRVRGHRRSSRPGRCARSICRPARPRPRRSIGWRPPQSTRRGAGRAARAAARAAQRVGAPAPDGRRPDGAVSVGRTRLQRADVVREPPRRAAQDVLDRVLVVGSGRRDPLRRRGRAPGRQRERAHRSRPREPRRSRSDRRRAGGAAGRQRRAAALVPLPRHRPAREGRALGRGGRRGARRIRPLLLGARSSTILRPILLRHAGAACCDVTDRLPSRSLGHLQRRAPGGEGRRFGPARRARALSVLVRHLHGRRAACAGRRRATTARPSATRRCSRPRDDLRPGSACSGSSTSTFRRCCSTTC